MKVKMTKQPKEKQLAEAHIQRTFNSGLELASEIGISNHKIKTDWPKSVINEANKLKNIREENGHYEDFRNKTFVTIDGKNAKDFDDAVLGEKDKEGNYVLYVAIADVARFVKPGRCRWLSGRCPGKGLRAGLALRCHETKTDACRRG